MAKDLKVEAVVTVVEPVEEPPAAEVREEGTAVAARLGVEQLQEERAALEALALE